MKNVLIVWAGFLLAQAAIATAGEPTTLAGIVRDDSNVSVGEILMHVTARSKAGDGLINLETRTESDGSFSIEVPDAELSWRLAVDERELLERGYFCLPDTIWNPGDFTNVLIFEAVPLRPQLELTRTKQGITRLQLSFDWAENLQPEVLRQYRIERTSDMKEWEEVVTLALACPPMMLSDETAKRERNCVYRAVQSAPVFISALLPEDFELIADPAMGWDGPPFVIIDSTEPLPTTPVVAPEIRVTSGE